MIKSFVILIRNIWRKFRVKPKDKSIKIAPGIIDVLKVFLPRYNYHINKLIWSLVQAIIKLYSYLENFYILSLKF